MRPRHAPCSTCWGVTPLCKAERGIAPSEVSLLVFGRCAVHCRMYLRAERSLCHLSGSVLKRSLGIHAGQRRGRSSSNSSETARALKQCIDGQMRMLVAVR